MTIATLGSIKTHSLTIDLVNRNPHPEKWYRPYGVPRGGVPVAYMAANEVKKQLGTISEVTYEVNHATIIIDDIIDSGVTRDRYKNLYPHLTFDALVPNKAVLNLQEKDWVVFPWEKDDEEHPSDNIVRLLQYVGEDPKRDGLIETPQRHLKYFKEITSGYDINVKKLFKTFEETTQKYDQMIMVAKIPLYSLCEHHLAPFFGEATVGYIPDGRIVGLSKIARVVDAFARRLQVQERLTQQIGEAMQSALNPIGVGVHVRCRHLCMESRGVKLQGHNTSTTALYGAFKEDAVKAEFLHNVRSAG